MRHIQLRERAQGMKHPADPNPVELSVDKRPPSLREQLQAYIRAEVSRAASQEGYGTFEEEDDFSEEEEEVWFSPHELSDMQADAEPGAYLETMDGTDDSPPPQTASETPPVNQTGGNDDQPLPDPD